MLQERLNDAAIALHLVLSRSNVPFGIFGGYAISVIGGVRESKDVDCLAAVSKEQVLRLLDGQEGFRAIPQSRQDYVAFFWSDREDRGHAVLVEIFCERFPGLHGTQIPVTGIALGLGMSSFLGPFHIFKGKLRAAATRSRFHDSADLRLLGAQHEALIRPRVHELSLEYIGLSLERYVELELLLGIDVAAAKEATKDVDLTNLPPPQAGDDQRGTLG